MTKQTRDGDRGGRPRKSESRPIVVGLVVSAILHVLIIAVYPFAGPIFRGSDDFYPFSAVEPEGTPVIELVEIAPASPARPDDPLDLEDPGEPEANPEVPRFEDPQTPLGPRPRTAAERLRAGQGDPRLWDLERDLIDPTPDQLLRLRLLAAIDAMNDSAAAEAQAMLDALDWTHTDDDGKKWGVSPGKIHLGGLTIPLPFGFGPPPDYNGDQAEMAFRLGDIERAAGTQAARMSWKERREAMRKRREERRAREAEEKNGSEVKPDTTSAR